MQRAFLVMLRLMGVLFLVSAGLQFNDPDPVGWVVVYTLGGLVCLWPRRGVVRFVVAAGTAATAWIWAAALAPRTIRGGIILSDLVKEMDTKTPQVELGRELLGLVILALFVTLAAVEARRGDPE